MTPPPAERLAPDRPLPPYTFIPGRTPRHPEAGDTEVVSLDPAQWQNCVGYLYGIDLFNAGFFWESHVEFERLWLAAGRRGVVADFLKGLIKLAAAGVKQLEERPDGVRSHARRAAELWRGVRTAGGPGVLLGLRLDELIAHADAAAVCGWPDTAPRLVPQR